MTEEYVTESGERFQYDPRVTEEGARVVLTEGEPYVTREPGDDSETPITVMPGATGRTVGYVDVWFDADIQLDDGRNVWICPDRLALYDPRSKQ